MPPKKSTDDTTNAAAQMECERKDKEVTTKSYDQAAVEQRMTSLNEALRSRKEAQAVAEDQLKKIPVAAQDVKVLTEQLPLSEVEATRLLRMHHGDLRLALVSFMKA